MVIKLDKRFKKDVRRDQKSGQFSQSDLDELKRVMESLVANIALDKKYLSHKLLGDWAGYCECHLKPNWLLIYKSSKLQVNFARLGTHQQLFKKY